MYNHWIPTYDRLYPPSRIGYVSPQLSSLDSQNRILNREVRTLIRENIILRSQLLNKDYGIQKSQDSYIGYSKQARLEREKVLLKEQQMKNIQRKTETQKKLTRDFSFGKLKTDERKVQTEHKYRPKSLELQQKPFLKNKKFDYLTEKPTIIQSLNQEKFNPETPHYSSINKSQNNQISQIQSQVYYTEEQAKGSKKNNIPYTRTVQSSKASPYEKFLKTSPNKFNEVSPKKNLIETPIKKKIQEQSIINRTSTNKKHFLSIVSKTFENTKKGTSEKKQKNE